MGGSNGQLCGNIHRIISIRKNHFLHVSVKHKKGKTIKNWFSHPDTLPAAEPSLIVVTPSVANSSITPFAHSDVMKGISDWKIFYLVIMCHTITQKPFAPALKHPSGMSPHLNPSHPLVQHKYYIYLSLCLSWSLFVPTLRQKLSPTRPSLSLCHLETI